MSPSGDLYIADTQNNRIRAILRTVPSFLPLPPSVFLRGKAASVSPVSALLSLSSSLPGLLFYTQTATSDGQTWLQAVPASGGMPEALEIRGDATALNPGIYQGAVQISALAGNPSSQTVAVTFLVDPGDPPSLQAQPDSLSFTLDQSSVAQSKTLRVINRGQGSINFTASALTTCNWLRMTPASATAASPASLTVTADPSGLVPGTYTATLLLTSPNAAVRVPVVLTINPAPQTIVLSQTGLTFRTTLGGGAAPPQRFQILSSGLSTASAVVTTQTAIGTWLSVSRARGSQDVLVSTDATGLAPAAYYGRISVSASSAANSPQYVSVVLNVLGPNVKTAPVLSATASCSSRRRAGRTQARSNCLFPTSLPHP